MSRRIVMRSVLRGFLGTYASRNSDYQGYWLFGLLLPVLESWEINLLVGQVPVEAPGVEEYAARLARCRFGEQLAKAHMPRTFVARATRLVTKCAGKRTTLSGSWSRDGHDIQLAVRVGMDTGRAFEAGQTIFVASHDPRLERRRCPGQWGQ